MGSFDVACGLSNLTIHEGDKAGLLIIGNTENYHSMFVSAPEPGKLMKIYATDNFKPFLPPVYGRYDDYGRLRDIEESVTTRLLETIYGRPIETVLKCLGSMRDIYGSLSDIYPAYVENDLLPKGYNIPIKEVLLAVGFTKSTVEDRETYSFGGYNLSQGESGIYWNIRKNDSGKGVVGGYAHGDSNGLLNFFGHYTNVYPCFNPNDYEKVTALNKLSGMFFLPEVFQKMVPAIADDYFVVLHTGPFQKEWDLFMDMFTPDADGKVARYASSWGTDANEFISKNTVIAPHQYDLLGVYKGSTEFLEVAQFLDVLRSINRMLEPTVCGEQQGNDEASAALNVITSSILDVRAKEYADEYEDEEDEEDEEDDK